jgi:acetyl-CoA carboxylase carboxyl transferase subunit beta
MRKLNLKTRYVLEKIQRKEVVICCMDFAFIEGIGCCCRENLKRNQSFYQNKIPFIMISKSGGARMMEAVFDAKKHL